MADARDERAAAKLAEKELRAHEKEADRQRKESDKHRRDTFKQWARNLKAKTVAVRWSRATDAFAASPDVRELALVSIASQDAVRAVGFCGHRGFMLSGGGLVALLRLIDGRDDALAAVGIAALHAFIRPRDRFDADRASPSEFAPPPRSRHDACAILQAVRVLGKSQGAFLVDVVVVVVVEHDRVTNMLLLGQVWKCWFDDFSTTTQ